MLRAASPSAPYHRRMAHAQSAAARHRHRLSFALLVSTAVFGVELSAGLLSNSLALVADAGHVFADVAGIAAALFAIWLAGRPPTAERSYGLYRLEIVAATANALLLLGVAGFVLWEGIRRLQQPPEIQPAVVVGVAVFALVANGLSLLLLSPGRTESLTVRGAWLEILGDLLGAAAVLVAGVVILATGFQRADALASILIALLILPRTWSLLRDSVDILLEATPRDVDLGEVRRHILDSPGVEGIHDLHAWTITSGMKVVSAHVVLGPDGDPGALLDHLGECLSADFDIDHSTFQLETAEHVLWEGRAARTQH
jgi:cobalt-zinc-cadmium efflux system protein